MSSNMGCCHNMRYNLVFISCDARLIERLQTALSADCAVMPIDPRQEGSQGLARRVDPNGIIIDAGGHPGARTVLEAIAAVRAQFSGLPLIAIGDEMSAQMVLASFRAGADDFLDRESSDTEIRAAILSRLRDNAAKLGGRVSAVRFDILSPGPADEDYDLSLNLAAMVAAADRSRRVLLLDLSLPASPVRLALGLEPALSVPLAVREMHRLDRAYLETALARSPETGLYVLPLADEETDVAGLPALNDLSILLQVLRATFDVVVVFWGPFSSQAFMVGDGTGRRSLLCCNQRFSSVRNAKALLAKLKAGGVAAGDVTLAVHLLAPNLAPAAEDIVHAVGVERFLSLRTSWAALAQAHNQGRPLSLQGTSPYLSALRIYLASEGVLTAPAETRASQLLLWLRKANVS